ncbi:MAG: peptide chain release factor 3, partial [Emcibacteraceae bacterium]|nr:peptide chain release factor 3 [Emcibacteraceae bacterium]
KLLLFGGAIQMAGEVKARGARRRARSDWMKVEQERGISVTSSVMSFEYDNRMFNLLDTPGHEDFSEDTYRVLTAVDSVVMVLDSAKGVEGQTLKLFEVCRLRDMPVISFFNKMDREAKDPFDLLDDLADKLALDIAPATWPIGMGRDFKGCYDLINDRVILIERSKGDLPDEGVLCEGIDDPKLEGLIREDLLVKLREEVEMVRELCPAFDQQAYLDGTLTPVYFGSAINTFGVKELLDGLTNYAPKPDRYKTTLREVDPYEPKVSGFVFKIQANMDPKHRDRIAFFRMVSGKFKRGMKLKHVRTQKQVNLHNPVLFLAQDRELAEEAWPGDIIGIPNHGNLRIGDSLTEGEELKFIGIPSFAPEYIQTVRPEDPMRAKHLARALYQLAEEGAARVFKPVIGAEWYVGVVGMLQFEVMADRIRTEYDVPCRFEVTSLYTAQWVEGDDPFKLKKFIDTNKANMAEDHNGSPVFLARNSWRLDKAIEENPDLRFLKTKEQLS